MKHDTICTWMRGRAMAAVACAAIATPLIGCGSGGDKASGANLPPVNDYAQGGARTSAPMQPAPRQGMSTGKKLVLLAGAAAAYYMWKKHQEAKQNGTATDNRTYYLSKNGQVYYRDANAQAHYVTPPAQGYQVPYDEAQQYSQLQGYNGQSTGMTDLTRFAPQGGM